VDAVADATALTLGPRGRYVVLDRKGALTVTNDGATVARELEIEGRFENQGARLVREVARLTEEAAGDGTTTATVLAQAIVRGGLTQVAAGASPGALRRGIEHAVEQVTDHLRGVQAVEITDRAEAARVAGVAAGDAAIGEMVADAFAQVDPEGVVNVVHGDGDADELELTEGMRFHSGYVSPHMITDPERGEAVLEDPYILIANQDVTSAGQLLAVLERVAPTGKPLLVIGDRVSGSALGLLVANIVRGRLRSVAVKAAYVGRHRREHLEEVAAFTGGESIAEMLDAKRRLGMTVQGADISQLGRARRVVVTRSTTTITGGAGDPAAVAARIERLRREIEDAQVIGERRQLETRIAHLAGAIAEIRVGAATETERSERRLRIEDAIKATRGALEEGIVPGGGVALLAAAEAIDSGGLGSDEASGAEVVRRALTEPLRRIAANAGLDGSVVIGRAGELPRGHGIDVRTGEYGDMVAAGVLDPTVAPLAALHAAASMASLVLATEAVAIELRAPDDDGADDELRYVPARRLIYGAEARAALTSGIDAVADAVTITLGPRGRHVIMDAPGDDGAEGSNGRAPGNGRVVITNDGASVARAIELGDRFRNQGARLVREVAGATSEEAGDGTTTATLLAQAIVRGGQRNVAAGADPLALRRGIERAARQVSDYLRDRRSLEVEGPERVARVAAMAAGDERIGAVVSEAFEQVGLDGVVNVEPGHGLDLTLDVVLGMRWANGYLSAGMATGPAGGEAVLEDAYILCVDRRISTPEELPPVLDEVTETGRPLLIVALAMNGEAQAALLAARARGRLTSVAVMAPDFLERRRRNLEDIAILTGGEAITEELGLELERVRLAQLGSARRVVVTRNSTTIIDGAGDTTKIDARIDALRVELERERLPQFLRDRLRERLARLASGVAAIKVGAATEFEIRERMRRSEDAVRAAEAALREGIVPGGGAALLGAQEAIDATGLEPDETTGAMILRRALEEPLRRIATSAGMDDSLAVERARALGPGGGLDAVTGEWRDLVEAGIIDPTLVIRSALEAAVSIAKTVLVSECVAVYARPPVEPIPDPEAGGASG
jgi:chaperonin GroEL